MKTTRFLSLLLCIVMLLGCLIPLASCKKDEEPDAPCTAHTDADQNGKCDVCDASISVICTTHLDGNNDGKCDNCGTAVTPSTPAQPGKTVYTIKVQSVGGMPLEGVTVYVHNSDNYSICTLPKDTDANGIATFELETSSNYSIQLDSVPNGYKVKEGDTKADRYPMTSPNGSVITLSSAPVVGESLPGSYALGDIINDVTLTDINGKTYKISELLAEKRMVMLNYWYVGCSWCAKEFPSLNASYANYKDQIEILALNDYGDSITDIKQYPTREDLYAGEENHLKFPFFQIQKSSSNLILDKFVKGGGYPTTIIIDRYGAICMIESGAIIGESKWNQIFKHFTADNYQQKLIHNSADLTPPELPDVSWGGSDGIAANLNGSNELLVEYAPETNEKDKLYSWPFVPVTLGNGITAVQPSNAQKDNSYAIMYATIQLKPGQAVLFDYFSSCDYGNDRLYVLVDGKDICSLTGVNEGNKTDLNAWKQCCAYVDPRPVTPSNRDELATYTVSFTYLKDSDTSVGDDTVYLRNLRVVPAEEIPTASYIFRYAATDLNDTQSGYNTYVDTILGTDGYYHVKNLDGTEGPLLLANFLSYTQFDSKQTMSQRLTTAESIIVEVEPNEYKDLYNVWMIYANASSNSKISGYTPVTAELKAILDAYCEEYRMDAGKAYDENLWLQLCIYYDAYGKDEQGNPAKPVENPILGLTTFASHKIELDNPQVGESKEYTVTYEAPIMPRGYLFEFIPTTSGVYRVTSHSTSKVIGWIYTGSSYDWAELGTGERILVTDFEQLERVRGEVSHNNVTMVAYMEAGKAYYIDIAFDDLYEVGDIKFDVKYVGKTYSSFTQASPGPITYIENVSGGVGQLIAIGIDYAFKVDEADGIKYAYHVLERDALGNVTKYGEKIYADLTNTTPHFSSNSVEQMARMGGFNFEIDEYDEDALRYLAAMRTDAKAMITDAWKASGITDTAALWQSKNMDAILLAVQKGDTAGYDAEDVKTATDTLQLCIYNLKSAWGTKIVSDEETWAELQMDAALRGEFSADEAIKLQQQDMLADIEELWNTTYKMDEVAKGIYHGELGDQTENIQKYIDQMRAAYDTAPEELKGCVAVTEELSILLSELFSKYVFDEVEHDWLKFCYYYNQLGAIDTNA